MQFVVTEYTKPDGIHDFLTYADNYAVGFFKKQGFVKGVHMDASRWQGYVKDYKDSTLMHCHVVPQVKYLNVPAMIAEQRRCVDERIKEISKSHQITYPALDFSNGNFPVKDMLKDIPGLAESGYKPTITLQTIAALHKKLVALLQEFKQHRCSWPFMVPVKKEEVPDYYEIVKDPIDYTVIEARLKTERFYATKELFAADIQRIFDNCRLYNHPSTEYYKAAEELEMYMEPRLRDL